MSTNIRFKRSDIPGKVPSLEALELGELAINSADGKLFTKQEIKQPAGFAAIQKIVEIGATAVPNVLYVSKGGDDSNSGKTLGESFASVKKALSVATPGTTIFLKSGEYIEDNPLRVPARVSIVGDNLRNTTVRPKNPTKDIFWVYNGAYIFCMNFKGHIAPSAAVCFPPDGSAGEIVTSPYTQAVTSITTTGTGMRVDGAVTTGLRSMVVDAFTQYNQGGIGIHMLNRGNTQLVSVFTICCDISFLCEYGGFCSINLSNSSFGNYGLVSRGASEVLYRGVVKKSAGRQITFKNLAKRPNIGDGVLFANYNQATCNRDNGLIVDSLAQDLLYEGTTQSTFAGLRYWAKGDITIGDQGPETVAALDHIKYVAGLITRDEAVTKTSGNTETQLRAGSGILSGVSAGTSTPQRLVRDGFAIVSGIVKNGPLSPQTVILPDYDLAEPEFKRLREQVLSRKAEIQDQTIAFISTNYPTLQYSPSKCSRDVGLIIDAVINDMIFGAGNYLTIKAARTYISTNGLVIPSNTTTATVEAIKFARDQVLALLTENTDATTYATDNFALITSSILAGSVTTPVTFTDYQDTNIFVKNLVTNLQANRTFIQENIIQYINDTYSELIDNYSEVTCKRDVGYVLDALCFDLTYGGNSETLDAAKRYYSYANGSRQIANAERLATTDAYGRVQLLSQRVVINDVIVGSIGTQNVSGTPTNQTQVNNLGSLFKLFLKQIDSEIVGTSDFIQPNGSVSTDTDLNNGYKLLQANKNFLKAEVIAYLTIAYPAFNYDRVKCARDIGYIVDSVCFDLVHGGNRQAVQSGIYYYGFSNESNVLKTVSPKQINQTINAYLYLKELLADVITCNPRPNPWQGTVEQRTSLPPATVAESYALNNLIDVIVEILREGPNNSEDSIQRTKQAIGLTASTDPNKQRAFDLLVANKEFIQAELSAYINLNWYEISDGDNTFARVSTATPLSLGTTTTGYPITTYQPTAFKAARDAILAAKEDITTETIKFMANDFFDNFSFNKPKCYRDVGLILDAILSDMIFGSNYKTINAAISYFRAYASDVIGPQKVQTIASLKAAKLLTLERIVTPAAKTAISTRFDVLIDILTNGTVEVPGAPEIVYPIPQRNSQEDIDRDTAVKILRSNIAFIKDEVTDYIDANFTLATYDREKCARDVALIVEALGYDLMFGSNFRSITAGRAYMRANAAKVVNGQKLATIGGFKQLKKLVAELVKDNTLAVNLTNRNMDIIIDIVESDGMNVPKFSIPFPATGRDAGYMRARDLVEKNREFIISDVLAYVNNPSNNTPVGYDAVKCERDLNLILDAVFYDITYGGTLETQVAASSYFVGAIKQLDPTGQNADEVAATIAAYTRLKSVISSVATDTAITRATGNSSVQFRSPTGSDGSPAAAADMADLIQLILSYIAVANDDAREASAAIANLTSTPDLSWVDSKLVASFNSLKDSRVTLQKAITGYIDENYVLFGYNRATCARDVGLVVDAVRYDMMFGSNFRSIVAGRSYWRAQASVVSKDQKVATMAAFEFLKTKLVDLVKTNETAKARVTSSMDIILDILENGPTVAPTIVWPAPTGFDSDFAIAKANLILNKEWAVKKIDDYLTNTFAPGATESPVDFTYTAAQKANCHRDVRFIIDAIIYDMTYGGCMESSVAGKAYYVGAANNALISGDGPATIAAYEYLASTVLPAIVGNSGTGFGWQTGTNPTSATDVTNRATALAKVIKAYVNGSNDTVALAAGTTADATLTSRLPSTAWVSNALVTLNASLVNATNIAISGNLPSAVTNFVDSNYAYNKAKCARDVGFIIDAMCYDILYGGNVDTVSAAQSYFDGAVTPKSTIPKQIIQTVAAYERLKDVLQDVVQLKQVTPSSNKFLAEERATANMDLIKSILENGEAVAPTRPFALPLPKFVPGVTTNSSVAGYLNARNLIAANREFFKAEVIAFIAANYSSVVYNKEICKRDVDYILDAVYYDMTYGGNMESFVAGKAYYDGTSIGAGEITATIAAYGHLKTLIEKVAENIFISDTAKTSISLTDVRVFGTNGTFVCSSNNALDVGTKVVITGTNAGGTGAGTVTTGTYYVIAATDTTFTLSSTKGGSAITGTVAGTTIGLTFTITPGVKQIRGTAGTSGAASAAGALITDIITFVDTNTGNNVTSPTPSSTSWVDGGLLQISNILNAVNNTNSTNTLSGVSLGAGIQKQVTDYINANYSSLTYTEATCQRDIGLIIDAVRYDLMFGTNFRSTVAGRSYARTQVTNGAFTTNNQKDATLAAIEFTKGKILEIIAANSPKQVTTANPAGSAAAATKAKNLIGIVLNAINETNTNPTPTLATTTWVNVLDSGLVTISNNMDSAKASIKTAVTDYIAANFSAQTQVTATAVTTNLITASRHGLVADQIMVFKGTTTGTGLTADTEYYVLTDGLTPDVFKVSTTKGGTAVALTTNSSVSGLTIFNYNVNSCERDIGLVIDAVRYDMMFGSNFRTIIAARSYYRAQASLVVGPQKDATIGSFELLKTKLLTYTTTNDTAKARVTEYMDIVLSVLDMGLDALPEVELPSPTGYNTSTYLEGYGYARNLIDANRAFIKAELTKKITLEAPTLDYNNITCLRDVDYIIDALRYDMTYDGTMETCIAAKSYYQGAAPADALPNAAQKAATVAAYTYLQTLVEKIALNQDVSQIQVKVPQVSGPVASVSAAQSAKNLAWTIRDYISTVAPDVSVVYPDAAWTGTNLADFAELLGKYKTENLVPSATDPVKRSKSFPQKVTDYAIDTYGNPVTQVTVTGAGTNASPYTATFTVQDTPSYTIGQAIQFTGDLANAIPPAAAAPRGNIKYSTTYYVVSIDAPNKTFTISERKDRATNTLTTLVSVASGQTGTLKVSRFDTDKCNRDTALLLDALRFDIAFDTNFKSIIAAKAYKRNIASLTNFNTAQKVASVAAFKQLKGYLTTLNGNPKSTSKTEINVNGTNGSGNGGDATTLARINTLMDLFITQIGIPLATVAITGTGGEFSCASESYLAVGSKVVIRGTKGGGGSITGYATGNIYYVIATNGSTTFTLSATKGGTAITTTAGTPTGLTYELVKDAPVKPYSIPTPTGANSLNTPLNAFDRNTLAARTAVENNREFIKAEVIAWIDDQNRRNTTGFTAFAYNRVKCLEDLDYILDAIYYDLTYGGNTETVNAGVAYYNGASLGADEITATERAYDYLGKVLLKVARNEEVDSFQLSVPQIRGIGSSEQVSTKLAELSDIIINVVKGGVKQIPERIDPDFLAGDETLAYVRLSIQEQKKSLQARIADYIDSYILQYSTEKCARDVGLIIDCVMYDLVLNSNFQSITAGSVYLQKAAGVVTSYQIGPQLEAIKFIRDKCVTVSQTPPLVKNDYIINEIKNKFDILYDIVDKGVEVAPPVVNVPPLGAALNPNAINAAKSLIANKEFLKEEVTAYITANYKTYDQSRCARDVGLIIDAALNDLLLGTNFNSIKAGTAYRRATSSLVISDQLKETLGGIDYALSLVLQLTTDATAIASITDSFELIKSIINQGQSTVPAFVTPLAGGSVYALPRATGKDFRNAGYFDVVNYLKNSTNVTAIKAAVSAFIVAEIDGGTNPSFTGFKYAGAAGANGTGDDATKAKTSCEQDIGYILEAMCYDLTYGGNMETMVAGRAYYAGTTNRSLLASEVNATIEAYTFMAKFIFDKLVADGKSADIAAVAEDLVLQVRNLIDAAYNSSPTATAPDTTWVDASYVALDGEILSNKETLKTQVVEYVKSAVTGANFDTNKCRTDLGYIFDAVFYDMLTNSNYQSVTAGLAYRRSSTSVVLPTAQKFATVIALRKAITLLQANVTNQTAKNRLKANLELVLDIIAESGASDREIAVSFPTTEFNISTARAGVATVLQNKKADIKADLVTYLSTVYNNGSGVGKFWADLSQDKKDKCSRDVGYIVDALTYDMTYGGNWATRIAAEAYYVGALGSVAAEKTATLAAYAQLITIINGYVGATTGITPTISDLIGYINTYITDGTTLPALVKPLPADSLLVTPTYLAAFNEFDGTDRTTAINDTVTYITGYLNGQTYLVFDEAKCARDVGLIVEAVRYDMMFNTTFRSIVAARSYQRAIASNVYGAGVQNVATYAAVTELRAELVKIVGDYAASGINSAAVSRIINLVNIVRNIIGGDSLPSINVATTTTVTGLPTPTGGDANAHVADIAKAKARIIANKAFLTEEVIAFIKQEKTNNRGNFNTNTGDSYRNFVFGDPEETKCRTDLGYILDAIIYDLTYGGNLETTVAGQAYYNGTVLDAKKEKLATLDAYRHLRDVIKQVITSNATITPSGTLANGASQSKTDPLSTTTVNTNFVAPLVTLVMNFIDSEPQDPVEVPADITWVPSKLYVFSDALNAAKATVAKTTTDYITANFPALVYNVATCQRDISLVIDAVRWDMMFNSNFRSNVAGRSYLRAQVKNGGFTTNGQKAASIKGFEIVKIALEDIVKSDATALARVGASMDVVIDILTNEDARVRTFSGSGALALSIPYGGTVNSFDIGYLNARDRIEANRDFIKAEIAAYIERTGASPAKPTDYDKAICLRDVDYILDAVRYDLTYGGNLATIEAGRAYYDGTSFSADYRAAEIAATVAAYGRLREILGYIAVNDNTSFTKTSTGPSANALTQVITGLKGSVSGAAAAQTLISELITYVDSSPGASDNAAARLPNTSWVNSNFVSFATTMSDTVDSLKQQVTDYVTATFPALTYTVETCARDVGYVVDAVRYDMMFDNEFRSYVAGRSYARGQVVNGNFTTNATGNQRPASIAAFKFLKEKLLAIVTGNTEAARRVTSAMRTLLDTIELGEVTRNSYDAVVANAISLLDANRTDLLDDMATWLPNQPHSFTGYNEDTCLRDIGYLLDAIKYDLTYGGNMETVVAGRAYYEGVVLGSGDSSHITATKNAFTHLSGLIAAISDFPVSVADRVDSIIAEVNQSIRTADEDLVKGKTYEIVFVGTTNWNTVAGTSGVTYAVGSLVKVAVVPGAGTGLGTGYAALVPTEVYADASWADVNLKEVNATFRDQIATIKTAVTDYVTANYPALTYDKVKCARDVGYVTDAISWDMLFNSNFRTAIAGRSYARLIASNGVFGANQKLATTAAFNYLKDQLLALTTNTVAQERISAGMNVILQILDKGPNGNIPNITWGTPVSTNAQAVKNTLLANKNFIVDQVIAKINTDFNPFRETLNGVPGAGAAGYDEVKCARDVGYIVTAVAYDIVTRSNYQSTIAALRYLGNTAVNVLGDKEKHMTIQSLKYVKQLLASIVANNLPAVAAVKAKMDLVIGIINGDITSTDAISTMSFTASYVTALDIETAQLTRARRSTIQTNVRTYLSSYNYNSTGAGQFWTDLGTTKQDTCTRDVGYIVDAITYDLTYGGNWATTIAARAYYTGTQQNLSSDLTKYTAEKAVTLVAYDRLKTEIQAFTTGNSLKDSLVTNDARVGTLIDIIKGVITGGLDALPTVEYPALLGANNDLEIARSNLVNAIPTVSKKTTKYINERAYFLYDIVKCERDLGFILDAVIYDSISGSNFQSITAGRSYLRSDAAPAIAAPQKFAILAALTHAKSVLANLVSTNTNLVTAIRTNLGIVIDIINDADTTLATLPAVTFPDTYTVTDNTALRKQGATSIGSSKTSIINSVTTGLTGTILTKCKEDVGYILDALRYDLLYGGNWASTIAARAYFKGNVLQIASGEVTATLAALDATATAVNALTGITGNSTLTGEITTHIAIIKGMINANTGVVPDYTPPTFGNLSTLTTALGTLLGTNNATRDASVNDVLGYINNREFVRGVYDPIKCARDVGLIIDAVAYDLALGSNFQSVKAGQAYLRSYSKTVTGEQKAATIGAMYFLKKSLSAALSAGANRNKVRELMDIVIDILDRGLVAVPALTLTTNGTAAYANAITTVANNEAFIKAEIRAYIAINYSQLDYDKNACERDVAYVLEALRYDLTYGGNSQTVEAGRSYWEGTTLSLGLGESGVSEKTATIAAYAYLKDTIKLLVLNLTSFNGVVPKQTSVAKGAFGGASDATVTGVVDTLLTNMNTIINSASLAAVETLTDPATGSIPRTYPTVTGNADFTLLRGATKTTLSSASDSTAGSVNEAIKNAFVGQWFVYNPTKCGRDIGYIVEALAYDMYYGGNSQTRDAGIQYTYKGGLVIPFGTKGPTILSMKYLAEIIDDIVLNTTVARITGNSQTQVTSYDPATTTPVDNVTRVVTLVNGIVTTLQKGLAGAPALDTQGVYDKAEAKYKLLRDLVKDNLEGIQDETIMYVNEQYSGFGYPQETCKRDIGLTLDAVAYDLIYGGNSRTKYAAEQYFSGGRLQIPADSKDATAGGFNYLDTLARKIVKNDYVTPLQLYVDQNTDNVAATTGEVNTVASLFDAFTDIVSNGYISVVTLDATFKSSVDDNTYATFHQVSQITTTGHTLEWVGTGIDVDSALPYNGGVPIEANEIVSIDGGFINFTSTDQKGDFKIGPELTIKRDSGSIVGRAFNKSLLGVITPYILALNE